MTKKVKNKTNNQKRKFKKANKLKNLKLRLLAQIRNPKGFKTHTVALKTTKRESNVWLKDHQKCDKKNLSTYRSMSACLVSQMDKKLKT